MPARSRRQPRHAPAAAQIEAGLQRVLGSDLSRVLKMTVYVADISLWGAVNETYARLLGEHRPARAVIPTRDLHHGFLVEIDAVAATRE